MPHINKYLQFTPKINLSSFSFLILQYLSPLHSQNFSPDNLMYHNQILINA